MKKDFNYYRQILIKPLLVASFFLGTFPNILLSQEQEISVAPKLTILRAELGIFDNNVKSEEYVAFKNSPITNPYVATIKDRYKEAYYNWLELDPADNRHLDLTNSKLNRKNAIFTIKKVFPPDTDLEKLYKAFIIEQWNIEDTNRRNFTEQYLKETQYAGGAVPYKFNYDAVKKIYNELKEKEETIGKDKFDLKKEFPFKSPTESEILRKHLSAYESEELRRSNFIYQYKIRDYAIRDYDAIQLSPILGGLIGFTHYYWGATAYNTCIPQRFNDDASILPLLETTKWQLARVTKTNDPFIKSTERVYIESACTNPNHVGWKIQRFFWMAGTGRALVLEPGKEYGGYVENAYFKVYRIGPKPFDPKTIVELGKKGDFDKLITGRIDPIDSQKISVTEKLKALIKRPDGLITTADGITFPNSTTGHDWSRYFGRPVTDNTGMSNLWMQLKVKYQLGEKTYEHIFNQWEEKIQIPTAKELTNALKAKRKTQNIPKLKNLVN